MEKINMKQAALDYAAKGIAVFPVVPKKDYPYGKWDTNTTIVSEQVEKMWNQNPNLNIGVATGHKSGLVVIRFQTDEAFAMAEKTGIPLTPIAKRDSGYDVYCKYQDGLEEMFDRERNPEIRIFGQGRYVLAPPSVIELQPPSVFYKPEIYSWCEGKSIFDVPLAEVPSWMLTGGHAEIEPPGVEEIHAVQVEDVNGSIECDHADDGAEVVSDLEAVVIEPTNDNKPVPAENEWKAPRLFDRCHVEEIKADVLPSWLGDYSKAISDSKKTPEGLAVMLGLSMVATCVQKKFVVAPDVDGDYAEQLALWTVTVLKSGERKSPILSSMRAPLVAWQKEQAVLLKDRILETSTAISIAQARIEKLQKDAVKLDDAGERQKRLNEINDIKRSMPVGVKAPVLWTSDVTPEELQDMLAEHGERMALLSAEGNIFEIMGGLYSDKVNIDIFLQAYSGDSTRINRRTRKAELDNPALTFGMAVQPTVIESFAKGPKSQFRGKGALARFLYCVPEPMVGQRDTDLDIRVPEEVKVRYEEGIKGLLSIPTPNVPAMLTLNDEAYKIYKDFDRRTEKKLAVGGELEQMNDWGGKLPGNALRVAGLMHLVEHGSDSTVIDRDTMAKAVHLCELLIEHAKAAFTMAGAYESSSKGKPSGAKKVFEWMEGNGFESFTKTDCHKNFKSWKKEELDAALRELIMRHIIHEEKEPTPGRTATNYISNPDLKA